MVRQTTLTAQDFLVQFSEFKRMLPDPSTWDADYLARDEPVLYRLKQLEALLRAFGLGSNLRADIQCSGFFAHRTPDDFLPLLTNIEKYAMENTYERKQWEREAGRVEHGLGMLFQILLRFSHEVRSLLAFNSGWYEVSSITARYSIDKTQKFLEAIDLQGLHEVEALLCKILDPRDRTFTRAELIANFGYPDVDLLDIDAEYA